MLKLTFALFLLSAVPFCNKCLEDGDNCADSFAFNIVDASSGNNLVFGPSPRYNTDSVYLTTSLPGYSGKMSYISIDKFQSALLIPVDTFFLKLSAVDTDTLLMKYDYVDSECCTNERYGKVSEIYFNSTRVQKQGDVFIFKK